MGRPLSAKPLPPLSVLKRLMAYDPETGTLHWRDRPESDFNPVGKRSAAFMAAHWKSRRAGKPAGGARLDGYATVMINGVSYRIHRVVWKIMTGEEPVEIDHINGNKSDNRFSNLRDAGRSLNMRNRALYANNKSGFPGVEFHKRDKVWVAKIGAGNRQVHLGNFPTKDEAIACKIGAQVILDYHVNHGRQEP